MNPHYDIPIFTDRPHETEVCALDGESYEFFNMVTVGYDENGQTIKVCKYNLNEYKQLLNSIAI